MRGGTENVPGIVGMGIAAEMAHKNLEAKRENLISLRDHMIERILGEIKGASLNGSLVVRSANNVNIRIDGMDSAALLVMLDMYGISASAGSACASGEPDPSHVLKAIGLTDEEAVGSIRFTLDEDTTMDDVNYVVNSLKTIIEQVRYMRE